ncbi:MAG TPA: hypothetical protein VN703_00260 [Candidatus Sulfopaludibacter sp.]|nr:hypothetical protein [Candidatus Sulfopaludibacter sp.]
MSQIQSIIFNKDYWTKSEARKWLLTHFFLPIKKVHETKNYYRYRIKDPNKFNYFITRRLKNNMELVIGFS